MARSSIISWPISPATRRINVETEHPEFRAVRWVDPAEFEIDWLPKMKREVYRAVFQDFFSVDI